MGRLPFLCSDSIIRRSSNFAIQILQAPTSHSKITEPHNAEAIRIIGVTVGLDSKCNLISFAFEYLPANLGVAIVLLRDLVDGREDVDINSKNIVTASIHLLRCPIGAASFAELREDTKFLLDIIF